MVGYTCTSIIQQFNKLLICLSSNIQVSSFFYTAVFNALADSRKNVVCEECSAMSANQKSTESDKDRDSDDYDNDYDNFAPPPHQNHQNNQQQNNIQQQQGKLYILFVYQCWY